jgi:hypothetical protein
MSNKRSRKRAALLYAGTLLLHDEGELSEPFRDELRDLGDYLLRQAGWDQTKSRWASVEEIEQAAR